MRGVGHLDAADTVSWARSSRRSERISWPSGPFAVVGGWVISMVLYC